MHLNFRNVNDAFTTLVRQINSGEIHTDVTPSRVGEVLQVTEPVIVTYNNPRQRVLFNSARDANPFFHLYESLWMLAGRNDIAGLCYYLPGYKDFSDDGVTANGAYGYRWRHPSYLDYSNSPSPGDPPYGSGDQLQMLIQHLKSKPLSRRAVLQMWNVEDDLLKVDSSKDVCCNTQAYFSVETGMCLFCDGKGSLVHMSFVEDGTNGITTCPKCNGTPHDQPRYLNITVCNRSNDMIWGMLGANVVHFSFLQEYMAAYLGLELGVYNQFTNNLHVYTSRWYPKEWLAEADNRTMWSQPIVDYSTTGRDNNWNLVPLVQDPAIFDTECLRFVEYNSKQPELVYRMYYAAPFLNTVAQPMMYAFHFHKLRNYDEALHWCTNIAADDWKLVATQWIEKRRDNYLKKSSKALMEQ
jgi:thymidylate synthase